MTIWSISRARLPENPRVNQSGHPKTYNFVFIRKLLYYNYTTTKESKLSTVLIHVVHGLTLGCFMLSTTEITHK